MTNAELIKTLRYCAEHEGCDYYIAKDCPRESTWMCGVDCDQILMLDAADALEAADKRIAVVEEERDLERFAAKNYLDKIDELKAHMPKEGVWIEVHDWLQIPQEERGTYRCSACGQVMKYPWNFCPNCGSVMKGGCK